MRASLIRVRMERLEGRVLMAADDGTGARILFATPEYNHGIPGVLKNAIDWASRPAADPAFGGKPVGIVGATPGTGATIRAQLSLRQSLSAAT